MNKEVVTRAFEKLGPEKVERGLTGTRANSSRCFLARAFGADGTLVDEGWRRTRKAWPFWRRLFGQQPQFITLDNFGAPLGLSIQETAHVISAFDFFTSEFQALAHEWLELNRTAAAPKVLV